MKKKKLECEKKLNDVDKNYEGKKKSLNEELIKTKNNVISNIDDYSLSLSDTIYEIVMQEKKKGNKSELKKLIQEICQ